MMCQACEAGEHELCGLQTWCACDDERDGEWSLIEAQEVSFAE